MKRMLLHICCAPCSTSVIETLIADFDVTGFFYNPNIHPQSQYQKRKNEMIRYAEIVGVPLVVADYELRRWFDIISGTERSPEGGERCARCFEMRLEKTARHAAENGFEIITTTLTVSPHKDANLINTIGIEVAHRNGIEFLEADFKKKGGYDRSVLLSREYGLFRQDYCGCIFSQREAEARRRKRGRK